MLQAASSTGPSASEGSGHDDGSTSAADTTAGDVDGEDFGDETDSETDDSGDPKAELCEIDLYGASMDGQLLLIDVDQGFALPREAVASRAIATHPKTGDIYLAAFNSPGQLLTFGPMTFNPLPGSVMVPDIPPPPVYARAAFVGNILLVGSDAGPFFQFDPNAQGGMPGPMGIVGAGGDFVLGNDGPPGELWIFNEVGQYQLLPPPMPPPPAPPPPPPPQPLPPPYDAESVTGAAVDRFGRLWLSLAGDGDATLVHLERRGGGWITGDQIMLDIPVDDLAPVVVPPGGCTWN